MATLIGLDVGDMRVGVSVATEETPVAVAHGTFIREKGKAEKQILDLIDKLEVTTLIVGLPLSDNGEKNEQCLKTESFCRRIQKRAEVRVVFVDEYGTSEQAKQLLHQARRGREVEHSAVDAASACLILQSYLDDPQRKTGA